MSSAQECDKCGKLYKPTLGCLTFGEVRVTNGDPGGTMDTWPDVDFCDGCSREVLKVIGRTLDGLDDTLKGKRKRAAPKGGQS